MNNPHLKQPPIGETIDNLTLLSNRLCGHDEPETCAEAVSALKSQQAKIVELEKEYETCDCCQQRVSQRMNVMGDMVCYKCCYDEAVPNLTSRIKELEEELCTTHDFMMTYFKENKSLQSRLNLCEDALREYGGHKFVCLTHDNFSGCNCGYEDALTNLKLKGDKDGK